MGVGRDELEAAAARLGGQRAREREDRPEADDEREERPVLVLEVAAQRLDIDRLAGQALQDRRHGGDDGRRSPGATRASRTGTTIALLTPMRSEPEDDRRRGSSPGGSRGSSCRRRCRSRRCAATSGIGRGRGRRAGSGRRWPCQAASTGVAAVLGEERLLERRLAADEVDELVARGRLDDRQRSSPMTRIVRVWSVDDDVADAGQAVERRARHVAA